MKNHPVLSWPAFGGQSDTDPPDRIRDDLLSLNFSAICDPTGRIVKWPGTYPVTTADKFGLTARSKMHTAVRFRGKNSIARALVVIGSGMYRSGPNNIYGIWLPVTWTADYVQPALDRPAAIAFRNRYAYHQNGVDIPFRVKMEEDDGTTASTDAEALGLRPPLWTGRGAGSAVNGTRFPQSSKTNYVVTFVYGDRGESGPSPPAYALMGSSENRDSFTFTIPVGRSGVTARRIYRTQIGRGTTYSTGNAFVTNPIPTRLEFFLHTEINDNTTTSFTDSKDDAALDYSTRLPPPRPFPPIARYQVMHQDRLIWANLRDNPLVLGIQSDPTDGASSATITVSNTGNGTITLTASVGGNVTISNYKTKTLRAILKEIYVALWNRSVTATGTGASSMSETGFIAMPAQGVDIDRTYRFREITSQTCLGDANAYWLEAIDDSTDTVLVDGTEKFPNRVMFSNLSYPEEINPLNTVDVSRNDIYPITGLFRNDYTLGVCTENDIWLITGSFSVDPETFAPDFSIARAQSEHGSFCTRPDAIASTPAGFVFVAKDGLRIFQGQASRRFGRDIKRRLMERITNEPRARDNLSMHYENGRLYIAYAGMEVG